MTLSLLRRPNGPLSVLTRSVHPATSAISSRHQSTLSAINDALRKAQKSHPKPTDRKPVLNEDGQPMNYRERQNARQALQRPDFKIRKGKKDITFDPAKARPLSRQKRFYDEDSSFAKKSLVYQAKVGDLREELKTFLEEDGSSELRGFNSRSTSSFRREGGDRDRPARARFDSGPRSSDSFRREGGDRDRPARFESGSRSAGSSRREGGGDRDRNGFFKGERTLSFRREGGDRGRPSRSDSGSRGTKSFVRRVSGERPASFASDAPGMDASGGSERPPRFESRSRSMDSFSRESRSERPARFESRSRSTDSFGSTEVGDRRPARSTDSPKPDETKPEKSDSHFQNTTSFTELEEWGSKPPQGKPRYSSRGLSSSFRQRDSFRDRRSSSRPSWGSRDRMSSRSSSHPEDSRGPPQAPLSIPYTTAASQFLYGKSVVEAAIDSSRRKLYKLYIYGGPNRQNMQYDEQLRTRAQKKGIEVEVVGASGARLLDKMSGGRPHNGYVLEASPLPQLPVNGLGPYTADPTSPGFTISLAHQSAEEALINGTESFISTRKSTHRPLIVVLDQILDPGNLGAILRTVSFLGASAVAITKRNSATLTPIAIKSSSGAAESLPIFSISNSVPEFLEESRLNGEWEVYAAVPETSMSKRQQQVNIYEVEDMDPLANKPCILVLGSEGEGLSPHIMSKADYQLSIPNLSGGMEVDSLNVSVAAGLLTGAFMKGGIKEMGSLKEEGRGEVMW